jgi:hypothetical protein
MTKYVEPKRLDLELTFEEISDLNMLRDVLVKGVETKHETESNIPPFVKEWSRFDKSLDNQRQLAIVEKILKGIK